MVCHADGWNREVGKMKRSEIVKHITTELFYGSLAARVDNTDVMVTELAEKDAEAVLKLIEKFNMKPPRYIACMANGKEFNPETDQGRDVMDIQAWEPENE